MFDFFKRTQKAVSRSNEQWFGKITGLFSRATLDDSVWENLEELLISADVAPATTGKLIERVRTRARDERLNEGPQVYAALKAEIVSLLKSAANPPGDGRDPGRPHLMLMVGVNGSGKTTSIAKLAHQFATQGKKVVLGAADTFRAAAIDQLRHWGERAGADVIAHQPGSDPGAVVFDTLQAAKARQANVIIIDTAGRLHTKFNLMEELKKIQRIAAKWDETVPPEVLLVIDATTGQNGLTQAKHFTEAAKVTGIFLSKLDGTARGGIVLTICDELNIPILYIGTGERLDDIAPFNADDFVEAIFANSDEGEA